MALTAANVAAIMDKRLGEFITEAGYASTGVAITDPMAYAARCLGLTPADPDTVTDAELASVSQNDYDEFLDLVAYRLLLNIKGNLPVVDVNAGPRSEKLSQLHAALDNLIEAHRQIRRKPSAGYISLDFAEHDRDVL